MILVRAGHPLPLWGAMMRKINLGPAATVLLLALSGCGPGAGGSIRYDMSVRNSRGTITVSDPKLYSRETLLNERARDVAWIDSLIIASEDPTKVVFKPALYREMEEISAFSAALGLKFDPAAAASYRRSNVTADVQQEIDVLKLQLQLEQLRRDAELLRAKLPDQAELANTGLGTLGAPAAPAATAEVTPGDVTKLTTAVNALITGLTSRLDAVGTPVGKTDVASSPAEDFRDRLAYRDMLKAARNAAGLDELHDLAANRLIRLNFQTTIFPDPGNLKALAAVQINVSNTADGNRSAYLLDWLRFINTQPEYRAGATTALDVLVDSGDFELVPFGTAGLVLLPVLQDATDASPGSLRRRAFWDKVERTDAGDGDLDIHQRRLDVLNDRDGGREAALRNLCTREANSDLQSELDIADARITSYWLIKAVSLVHQDLKAPAPAPAIETLVKYERSLSFRRTILEAIAGRQGCEWIAARYGVRPESEWRLLRRPELATSQQVRVYEVGPREQAAQVSTLARSANSLALAAAIAGSAPGAGVGAELGAAYRRDTMNRASALERVPEVVGYSLAGNGTFGWVIGPRATTDTRGRAELQQLLKPYDLSVDLAVPSWWSYMNLDLTTVWAPSPRDLVDGALRVDVEKDAQEIPRKIVVALPAVPADFRAFTQLLLRDSVRKLTLDPVVGGPVNACSPTTLLITGENIWRTQRVMLLGITLDRSAFVISPDMHGILVTVPAIPAIPGDMEYQKDDQVHVLTPLGPISARIAYASSPSGDACKPAKATDPSAVTVKSLSVDDIFVPSLVTIDVTGTNFAAVDAVTLAGQPGAIIQRNSDGTMLRVEFDEKRTSSITARKVQLQLYAKMKPVGTAQDVRVTRK